MSLSKTSMETDVQVLNAPKDYKDINVEQEDENDSHGEIDLLMKEAQSKNLHSSWTVWTHNSKSNSWTLDSYKKVLQLNTIYDLVCFANNFPRLDVRTHQFFVMRGDVKPIWEDEQNRKGGVCSLKTDNSKNGHDLSSMTVWTYLLERALGETCCENMDDINGLSFCSKNNWAIIKIWNRDKVNDLSETLSDDILQKYESLSIKYKANEPEY